VTGDWQKFKGLPAPEPMKMAPPKVDKLARFNAALAETSGEPTTEATTPRKRAAKKVADEPTASRRADVLEEALEHLVRGIVDHPDDVHVDMVNNRQGPRLEVRVHPDDLGRVIGRNGRTAKALRQVVAGVGGKGIRVDVIDVDRP